MKAFEPKDKICLLSALEVSPNQIQCVSKYDISYSFFFLGSFLRALKRLSFFLSFFQMLFL